MIPLTPFLRRCLSHCGFWIAVLLLFSQLGVCSESNGYNSPPGDVDEDSLSPASDSYFSKFIRKRSIPEPVKLNRCELKLVADFEFFRVIGNSNYANAARYLVNMIERINGIFSQVDWGVDINGNRLVNLGFSIKEIKIFDRPSSSSPYHFNSLVSINEDGSFYAYDILKSFSEEEGTNSTCLTILVSAKIFDQGILGVANIGEKGVRGLCATKPLNNTYFNTLVISVRRKSELMITRVVDLVAAHEFGHAWGAIHDNLEEDDCISLDTPGRFVMHESSNTGYDKTNYQFSNCSIRAIHKVLYGLAHRCFVEEKSALCGNGILEAGEECDSGDFGGHLSGEATSDLCCTRDCRLRPSAVCSPRHSECCTIGCKYSLAMTLCQPRSPETCKKAIHCAGNSSKCPEPEPIEDGTECVDEGRCFGGECISFCENISKNLAPCICENIGESCQRCCRSMDTGICKPVTPKKMLAEGSICIQGQCHNNVCEKKVTDEASLLWKIFRNFKETPDTKFFADYFVFIIVFASLLIWCPCGAYIVYNDRRRHLETIIRDSREDIVHVDKTNRSAARKNYFRVQQ